METKNRPLFDSSGRIFVTKNEWDSCKSASMSFCDARIENDEDASKAQAFLNSDYDIDPLVRFEIIRALHFYNNKLKSAHELLSVS